MVNGRVCVWCSCVHALCCCVRALCCCVRVLCWACGVCVLRPWLLVPACCVLVYCVSAVLVCLAVGTVCVAVNLCVVVIFVFLCRVCFTVTACVPPPSLCAGSDLYIIRLGFVTIVLKIGFGLGRGRAGLR